MHVQHARMCAQPIHTELQLFEIQIYVVLPASCVANGRSAAGYPLPKPRQLREHSNSGGMIKVAVP